MATIHDVQLRIDPAERSDQRRVTVSYRLCFSGCEALAETVFVEKVVLRGDDPLWDDNLITLRNICTKAVNGCVKRSISTVVSRSALDEDPDTIIFGWVIGDRDEIYAQVSLAPFVPSGHLARSNLVTAHFGPAGA